MATKLQVWNKALRLLGLPRLSDEDDNFPTAFELEDAWATVVLEVWEAADWNYATKHTSSVGDTVGHTIGYTYRHDLPADWVRTITISPASDFSAVADYRMEGGYIQAQDETIYIRYIASTFITDGRVPDWPPSFAEAVAAKLALELVPVMRPGDRPLYELLAQVYQVKLEHARLLDDANQHVQHRSKDLPSIARKG